MLQIVIESCTTRQLGEFRCLEPHIPCNQTQAQFVQDLNGPTSCRVIGIGAFLSQRQQPLFELRSNLVIHRISRLVAQEPAQPAVLKLIVGVARTGESPLQSASTQKHRSGASADLGTRKARHAFILQVQEVVVHSTIK